MKLKHSHRAATECQECRCDGCRWCHGAGMTEQHLATDTGAPQAIQLYSDCSAAQSARMHVEDLRKCDGVFFMAESMSASPGGWLRCGAWRSHRCPRAAGTASRSTLPAESTPGVATSTASATWSGTSGAALVLLPSQIYSTLLHSEASQLVCMHHLQHRVDYAASSSLACRLLHGVSGEGFTLAARELVAWSWC